MKLISDFTEYQYSNSAVLLADGSLESTVLAFAYADCMHKEKQTAQLTLLHVPKAHDEEPLQNLTIVFVKHLCETLRERYPLLTVRQEPLSFTPSPFLFSNLQFTRNMDHFLWLVTVSCTYGNILLAPLCDDGHFPGQVSPFEIVKATNVLLESLSVRPMNIVAPLHHMTKEMIVRLAREIGMTEINLAHTFDCEDPVEQNPCFVCRRCIARMNAFTASVPVTTTHMPFNYHLLV